MTDTERNELVEKLAKKFYPANEEQKARARESGHWYLLEIESLGYEIVKKEELDCLKFKLDQMEQIADMATLIAKKAIETI